PRYVRSVPIFPQSHVSRHCGYAVGCCAVARFVADAGCTGRLPRVHVACFHSLRGADATRYFWRGVRLLRTESSQMDLMDIVPNNPMELTSPPRWRAGLGSSS